MIKRFKLLLEQTRKATIYTDLDFQEKYSFWVFTGVPKGETLEELFTLNTKEEFRPHKVVINIEDFEYEKDRFCVKYKIDMIVFGKRGAFKTRYYTKTYPIKPEHMLPKLITPLYFEDRNVWIRKIRQKYGQTPRKYYLIYNEKERRIVSGEEFLEDLKKHLDII